MNSEQIGDLIGALALAQMEFPAIPKTKTGKVKGESKGTGKAYEFEYQYADIADVLSAVRPILSKHELAILQLTEVDEANVMWVRTRLAHKSGQWIESVYPVCSINADHQKMGGALTYSRRYSLSALLGVAAEDDLDGQGGSAGTVDTSARAKPMGKAQARPIDAEMRTEIDACSTVEELEGLWKSTAFKAEYDKMPKDWQGALVQHFKEHKALLVSQPPKVPPNFDKLDDDTFPGDIPLTQAQKVARTP